MNEEIVVTNAPQGAAPAARYKPWTRPLTYVVFGLGMSCAGFLMFCVLPYAVVMGWFALGCGIPAVLLARKEITPEHLATIARVLDAFPGSRVVAFDKKPPAEPANEGSPA